MKSNLPCAAIVAASMSACAFATVTASPTGGAGSASAVQDGLGRYIVTCTATSQDNKETRFTIEGDDNDVILSIHIQNNSLSTQCDVTIRKKPGADFGIASIGEITWGTTTGQPVWIENMQVDGNVGNIEVSVIESAFIEGDLIGDVFTTSNAIVDLIVDGNIGSSTTPSTIESMGNINRISVGVDVYANIDSAPTGSVSDWLGAVDIGGNFYGSIKAPAARVNSGIPHGGGSFIGVRIDGETHGTVTFDRFGRQEGVIDSGQSADMEFGDPTGDDDGELSTDGKVFITKEFGTYGNIAVATGGLKGQITINAGNATSNAWQGTLTVGSLTLPEEYSTLPSAIGGGAAGVAPFTLHASTASPAYDANVVIRAIDIYNPQMGCDDFPFEDPVSFRLYGPATLVSGTGPHANVEVWNGSSWVDAGFDVETEIVSSTGSRGLKFTRKDGSGNPIAWPNTPGEYRIVPVSGRITSTDVTGTPTVDFDYRINLIDICEEQLLGRFDLNSDNSVDNDDMGEWLLSPCDLNDDSNVDEDDADLLLQAIGVYQSL